MQKELSMRICLKRVSLVIVTTNKRTRALQLFVAMALLLIGPAASAADVSATWNGSNGNWSDGSKWSTNPLAPNNGNGGHTYDTVVNAGSVTLDSPITIEKYVQDGGTLLLSGA